MIAALVTGASCDPTGDDPEDNFLEGPPWKVDKVQGRPTYHNFGNLGTQESQLYGDDE